MTENITRLSTALAHRYRIERQLGEGGMATVYLAEDLKHQRKVAVKVLRPELAAVIGAKRFLSEITTTANLQHPHILPLHDSGEVDGTVFYVMPLVEGESLRDRLDAEKQLPVNEAVRIARDVAGALDYAHRHDVIHRDIKPENILLHDGQAMVADFGIALAANLSDEPGRLTETGMSLGTPHYMSPEQAMGERALDARADVYALGCVLYELLAGEPPFTGPTAQTIIAKVMTGTPEPVITYRKTVPPNVVAAIHCALEKLPADRFATAAAFAAALENESFTAPGSLAIAQPTATSNHLTMIFAGVAVAAIGIAAWALLRPAAPNLVIRYGLDLPPGQRANPETPVRATPDGSHIVYVGRDPDDPAATHLWVKARDSYEAVPLDGTVSAEDFAISPDGSKIAFVVGGQLKIIATTGGVATDLTGDVGLGRGIAWLHDQTIVFAKNPGTSLHRIKATGGEPVEIWATDSLTVLALDPLPNSRGVLFQACPPPCGGGNWAVWAFDFRTDSARVVVPGAQAAHYVPTGHLLFLRGTTFGLATAMGVPFDLGALRMEGTPVTLLEDVAIPASRSLLTISESGTLIMRSGALTYDLAELVWVDRTGNQTPVDTAFQFRFTEFAGNVGWALSPAGDRLAMGRASNAGDDIWVKSLPRGPASRLSFDPREEFRPRWTSDGRSVTFISTRVPSGVYQRRADGTGTDSLVLRGESFDEAVFSPDGRWLLVRLGSTSALSGGRDIMGLRVGIDTTLQPLLTGPYDEQAMALAPDGRWLAYQSDETGQMEVFVRPFPNIDDGKQQVSNGGGIGPLWARDGRELYFVNGNNDMMAVPASASSGIRPGNPERLFTLPPELRVSARYYTPWDIAPDGRFIMARTIGRANETDSPLIVVENFFEELKQKIGN